MPLSWRSTAKGPRNDDREVLGCVCVCVKTLLRTVAVGQNYDAVTEVTLCTQPIVPDIFQCCRFWDRNVL